MKEYIKPIVEIETLFADSEIAFSIISNEKGDIFYDDEE